MVRAGFIACMLMLASIALAQEAEPPVPVASATTSGGSAQAPADLAEHARTLSDSGHLEEDGLEAEAWRSEAGGNPAALLNVDVQDGERTFKRLAVELQGGAKDYASIKCEGAWRLKLDRGARTHLVVFNATAGALRFSLAYSVGKDWEWHESPAQTLKPGWNRIRIEQGAADFKAERTQWKHAARLSSPLCRAVNLVLHSGGRTGRLFVEALRVDGEKLELPKPPERKTEEVEEKTAGKTEDSTKQEP
ncbi:MAG: hypothetical protein M5U26_28895 [Planctomycetota bacterium]|nr:hypothetical protein [Planctomycetota bacterium]